MKEFDRLDPTIRKKILEAEEAVYILPSPSKAVWNKLIAQKFTMGGLAVFLAILFLSIVGPFIASYSFSDINLDIKNQSPSTAHWFGTDELGRDFFTRCMWGVRISLFIGFSASIIDLAVGVLYGSIAGYVGGRTDECMMRVADILYTIPYFLVVILIMVINGPGVITIVIALSITGWINMARIVRVQVMQIKGQDFITAVYAFGGSHSRVLFRHLIPNMIGPIIVTLTFTIPTAMFGEAFLSFLGLGVQSPYASLGTIASDGLAALKYYPWRLIIPAILISLSILSLNIIGDGLREALEPKLRAKI